MNKKLASVLIGYWFTLYVFLSVVVWTWASSEFAEFSFAYALVSVIGVSAYGLFLGIEWATKDD
jgi:hypothetical protein